MDSKNSLKKSLNSNTAALWLARPTFFHGGRQESVQYPYAIKSVLQILPYSILSVFVENARIKKTVNGLCVTGGDN